MQTEEQTAASLAEAPSDDLDGDAGEGTAGPQQQRETLIDVLEKASVASHDALRVAMVEGLRNGERLGEVVLRRGWIDEDGLARLVARQWDQPFLEDDGLELDPHAVALLPADVARELKACAIRFEGDVLTVAMAEPADERLAAVRTQVAREVAFAVVTRTTLDRLLDEAAELPFASPSAEAGAASATYPGDADPESLLSALDSATEAVVALRGRAEALVRIRAAAHSELATCRERVTALEGELASEREAYRLLEDELAQQRERLAEVKEKLGEFSRTLDGS